MPDMLETGLAWLDAERKAHVTRTVIYSRGGAAVELAATPGKSEYQQTDLSGTILQRFESRDWLVTAADLKLEGQSALPVEGDQIREPDGDKTLVYEVMSLGDEGSYRFCDPYRKTLRIHTKQVGVEP